MCIYSYDAFIVKIFLTVVKNRYTGEWLIFFAWGFKGLSQTAAKHTTQLFSQFVVRQGPINEGVL